MISCNIHKLTETRTREYNALAGRHSCFCDVVVLACRSTRGEKERLEPPREQRKLDRGSCNLERRDGIQKSNGLFVISSMFWVVRWRHFSAQLAGLSPTKPAVAEQSEGRQSKARAHKGPSWFFDRIQIHYSSTCLDRICQVWLISHKGVMPTRNIIVYGDPCKKTFWVKTE